jgi:hypothetical protein
MQNLQFCPAMQNFPKIPGLFSKQIISVFFSKILSTLPVPGKASDINYQFCQTSRLFQVFSASKYFGFFSKQIITKSN